MQYVFTSAQETVARRSDGVFVPWGPEGPLGGGEAWRQWEADGKPTPAPYVPPPAPPRSTHKAWFKAALNKLGRLEAVEALVATLPAEKQILWNDAIEISEADPDVNAVAAALKIDLAAIFDEAEALRDARGAARS